jgi:hypothetical protein
MTDVLAMPGVQTLHFAELTVAQKTARIEDMASMTGLTPEITADMLRLVAPDHLVGEALMLAWLRAEDAIVCRDGMRVLDEDGCEAAPELQDPDFEDYKQRAADAICDLIHGINIHISTARGSGFTPRGNA